MAKIGGSCLSTKDDIRRTIEIVEKIEEKPILVVSAFKGVTDELIAQAQCALTASFNVKKIERLHSTHSFFGFRFHLFRYIVSWF